MYTYLALGDSYTIGELVPMHENFPFQTVDLLRKNSIDVADPVIIATTGWTTDELAASIMEHNIMETFSFVTLLIGVNNQYRGRSLENYREEYLELLNQAIAYAGGITSRVFVLSIPDWAATPFAEGKDRNTIALEIDDYNAACRFITMSINAIIWTLHPAPGSTEWIKPFWLLMNYTHRVRNMDYGRQNLQLWLSGN